MKKMTKHSYALATSVLVLIAGTTSLASAASPAASAAALTPAKLAGELSYKPLREFKIPKPERVVLANGMVLLLLPDRDLPLVEGTVLIHAGGRLEPKDKIGLASLTGTVLRTGGTKKHRGDEIDDLLESIGARVESGIDTTQGRLGFSCLSRDADAVLALVAEILREPVFEQGKLDVALGQTKAGISRRNDQIQSITGREFRKLVYGSDSVYARYPEYATLGAISQADLVAFHAAHFVPNATLVGMTGDFDPKAMRALIEKHFGSWKKGAAQAKFSGGYAEKTKPGMYFVEKSDVNQSNVTLGHLGITTDNPDYYAVSVLNEVFGGGFSARLFSNVRSKKGLAYSVGGGVGDDYDHPGAFRIALLTKSETTVAGLKALHEELDAMRAAPPAADELKRSKDAILNSFVFRFDSLGKVLERQLAYEYYAYPLDFLDRYRAGIDKVSAADVHRVAQKYMHPEQLVELVVGRSKDFDKPLADLGTVTALDITIPAPVPAAAKETPAAAPATR